MFLFCWRERETHTERENERQHRVGWLGIWGGSGKSRKMERILSKCIKSFLLKSKYFKKTVL